MTRKQANKQVEQFVHRCATAESEPLTLPTRVDLRSKLPPAHDQGNLGSSVACTVCTVLEIMKAPNADFKEPASLQELVGHQRQMNMKTPRTDAAESDHDQSHYKHPVVSADFARQLETDLQEQHARFNGESVRRILKHISTICGECGGEITAVGCAQCWQKNADDFAIRVAEFMNDWSKGDFALPTLAAHDAEALKRPLETFAKLKVPAAMSNIQDQRPGKQPKTL